MAKLTKAQTKQHNQILDLIYSDKPLTLDEKEFILQNYNEAADVNVGPIGSFHTPMELAYDFAFDIGGGKIIDMCAGIGMLSFCKLVRDSYDKQIKEVVCVEYEPKYVEIGKRIVPEASWIIGDVLSIIQDNKYFDWAFSNPPFGNIKTSDWQGKYTGGQFEYKVVEKASRIAHNGSFILPQTSAGFKYSGAQYYQQTKDSDKYNKFVEQTKITFHAGVGIDSSIYRDQWKNTNILVESCIAGWEGNEYYEFGE